MRLEFNDEALERLAYEPDSVAAHWSDKTLRAYRRTIYVIRHARYVEDLTNLTSLAFRVLTGHRAGCVSVRIVDPVRLVLRVSAGSEPVAEIIEVTEKE